MRYLFGFLCVCALGMVPLASFVGCGDEAEETCGGEWVCDVNVMPINACLDDSDVIWENLDQLGLCHALCFLEGEGALCVSQCVVETGVSGDCAGCYFLRADCVVLRCEDLLPTSPCLADAFAECTDDNFKECTGGVPCGGIACPSDGNECTDAVCSSPDGICQYPPVEGEPECNGGIGTCQAGECVDAMKCEDVDCDDDDACTDDSCDPTNGECSSVPRCVDNNVCTDDVCDPADGVCSNPPVPDETYCGFMGSPFECHSGECVLSLP